MAFKIITLIVLLANVIAQGMLCFNSFMKVKKEHMKERPAKYPSHLYFFW